MLRRGVHNREVLGLMLPALNAFGQAEVVADLSWLRFRVP